MPLITGIMVATNGMLSRTADRTADIHRISAPAAAMLPPVEPDQLVGDETIDVRARGIQGGRYIRALQFRVHVRWHYRRHQFLDSSAAVRAARAFHRFRYPGQMCLQNSMEKRLLIGIVLIQRSYRNSRPLRHPRGRQPIRSHGQQNLNGGFRDGLHGDRRTPLNGRLSWLKRMRRRCLHNANSEPEGFFI